MLALLLASVLPCLAASTLPTAPRPDSYLTAPAGDDKPLKALDAWLKLYRSGKMDLREKNIAKDSLAMKFGIAPKNGLGTPTWLGDLEVILEAVAKLDDAEAAKALVEVAAIGLDTSGKYTTEMAPYEVRAVGERLAARLTSAPAKEELAKAARGEIKVEKARMAATRTAAVKCLGLLKDPAFRPVLEQALADPDEKARVNAAEALGALGDEAAALPLVALLERDTADVAVIAATQALKALYAKYVPKPGGAPLEPAKDKPVEPKPANGGEPTAGEPKAGDQPAPPAPAAPPAQATPASPELPESVRLAVRAAIRALGRTTWRADMQLISLLDEFRSLETVPALIAQLEYFFAHPEEVKSGKLSGLALYQGHELLVSMTGAVFPADQPEKWRAFWNAEKDKIAVTEKRNPAAAGAPTTVVGSFCGIPVQGTRVVFVVDLSGSMDWPMADEGADGKKKKMIRLDFAKRELKRAMDLISPNAQFNLITFNGNPKADQWKPAMMPATPQNRDAFKKYADGLRADGGTNVWSGLEDALKIKSVVFGNRYTTNIDELFVLSDGAPTVGDVQNPTEILRLVKECNKSANVRINTIYISSETPPEHLEQERELARRMGMTPQEFMRRMAEENGGKFREL